MKPTLNKIILIGALTMALSDVALATPQDNLHNVVEHSRLALMQKYVVQGVSLNLKAHDDMPLLVDALREKNIEVVEAFIRAKSIDSECINVVDGNALTMATYQGLLLMVKLMAETYDVEVNKTGWAALHYATTNGYDDIAKHLFDHVAYVDARSPNTTTPLMMTAMDDYIATARLLLGGGTDMNPRSQQRIDVIDFVRRYYQDKIVTELEPCRRKLAKQSGKPASAPIPATTVSPSAKVAAPGVPTPVPPAKRDAGVSSPVG